MSIIHGICRRKMKRISGVFCNSRGSDSGPRLFDVRERTDSARLDPQCGICALSRYRTPFCGIEPRDLCCVLFYLRQAAEIVSEKQRLHRLCAAAKAKTQALRRKTEERMIPLTTKNGIHLICPQIRRLNILRMERLWKLL